MSESPWITRKRKEYGLPPETRPSKVWYEDLKRRPHKDDDAQILVSGRVRRGKSTCAYQMARRLDPTFDYTRMVFSIEHFREVAEGLPDGTELPAGEVRCVVWDEVIEGGLARAWQSGDNTEMVKFFTVCGERNLIGFQLSPHIDMFDPMLRTMRATDWVLIPKRGRAKGHVRGDGGDYPGRRPGWMDLWKGPFNKVESTDFDLYKEAKREFARKIGASIDDGAANPFSETPGLVETFGR